MPDPKPTAAPALDAWRRAAARTATGGDLDRLNWVTPEGIVVKPLYTAADLDGLAYADTLPGFPPYVRGPYVRGPSLVLPKEDGTEEVIAIDAIKAAAEQTKPAEGQGS